MALKRSEVKIFDGSLIPETIDDVLLTYGNKWIQKLRDSIDKNNRNATESLKSSMVAEPIISPSYFQLRIIGEKYWRFVDKGVNGRNNKFGSPYSFTKLNLKKGVMLKHIADRGERYYPIVSDIANNRKNSKGVKVARKVKLSDIKARKSLAFLLGRKIASQGIKPTNFVSEAITKQDIADFKKDIAKAFKKGLK